MSILMVNGRVKRALRTLFADESDEAVEEFVDAAEAEPRLTGICLLLALDLAEQAPSDHSLLILEEVLRRNGLHEDAQRIDSLLVKPGPAVEKAIDSLISGEALSEEARQSVVAEYQGRAEPGPTEIQARQAVVAALRERIK